jgi:hypothetical protein
MRVKFTSSFLMFVTAVVISSCGSDDATGPTTGDIRVGVTASGASIKAGGYTVVLDDGSDSRVIEAGEQAVFDEVAAGPHTVEIRDVGSNCQLSGPVTRAVTVVGGEEVVATFSLTCDALVAGAWYYESDVVLAESACRVTAILNISQTGSTFGGTVTQRRLVCPVDGLDEPLADASIANGVSQLENVEFDFDDASIHHTGTLNQQGMSGSVTYQLDASSAVGTWTAGDIGAIP